MQKLQDISEEIEAKKTEKEKAQAKAKEEAEENAKIMGLEEFLHNFD